MKDNVPLEEAFVEVKRKKNRTLQTQKTAEFRQGKVAKKTSRRLLSWAICKTDGH